MASSRKSTKVCPRGSRGVKSHRHGSKKVKSYCRKVSRKASRKTKSRSRSRSPSRKLKCMDGQVRVKSHRHGSKRVKPYCRKAAVKKIRELQEKIEEIKEVIAEEDCGLLTNKDSCERAMDKENLRRCRYNMSSNKCEFLPMGLRQRATMGVGGSAEYKPYAAPERRKVAIPSIFK